MNILIVGSGGREHAIGWSFSKSRHVPSLYFSPGNPGTSSLGKNIPISVNDIDGLVQFVLQNKIDMVVIGPELPIALGLTDALSQSNFKNVIGPSQFAGKLESSKSWAKEKMKQYGIPTANYHCFDDYNLAIQYLDSPNISWPIVIKADGLAGGKGVVIAYDYFTAKTAVADCLVHKKFKEAGNSIVIEEFLEGEEVSMFAFSDGKHILPLSSSQDHKAVFDGNKGPNTGGMGAYSPVPFLSKKSEKLIEEVIFKPLIKGLLGDKIIYKGIIYAGLIIKNDGSPWVIEFNVRFGDPEAEVILPRLKTDLVDICIAICEERLEAIELVWDAGYCVGIVVTSEGYPEKYSTGHRIYIPDKIPEDLHLWHSGTSLNQNNELITNGGRVLCISSVSNSLSEAIKKSYDLCKKIKFQGKYFRKDIAKSANDFLKLNP